MQWYVFLLCCVAVYIGGGLLIGFVLAAIDDIAFVRRRCPICGKRGCLESTNVEMFFVQVACERVRICGNCAGRSILQEGQWVALPPGNP